jgi:hypothetical protein
MPLELIAVLVALALVGIPVVYVLLAPSGSRRLAARLRRGSGWLGRRMDESVAMAAVRAVTARGSADGELLPAERLRVQPAPSPVRPFVTRARLDVDPRWRLWRDALLVLLIGTIGALALVSVPGFEGGVAGATATPGASTGLLTVGGSEGPGNGTPSAAGSAASPALAQASPTAATFPTTPTAPTAGASSPPPTPTPRPTATATPRPTHAPTPRSPAPSRPPTPSPATPTPTPTPEPPIARITELLVTGCLVSGGSAQWTFGAETSSNADAYEWAFAGGPDPVAGSTAVSVTRDLPGTTDGVTYTVTLTVTSSGGASDSATTQVTVTCP